MAGEAIRAGIIGESRGTAMIRLIQHLSAAVALGLAGPTLAGEIAFDRDVRPILAEHCFACHGPDAAAREADLRLDTREGAVADHAGVRAVVPGNGGASELVTRIRSTDPDVIMPPPDSPAPPCRPARSPAAILWTPFSTSPSPRGASPRAPRPTASRSSAGSPSTSRACPRTRPKSTPSSRTRGRMPTSRWSTGCSRARTTPSGWRRGGWISSATPTAWATTATRRSRCGPTATG
ncbi:MAG: hypothetical protein EBX35_11935 [Planctomycetia bacterium]|nr:hypothetical protein [Planctomycetia bacterium]